MSVADNIRNVQARIQAAARRSGRDPESITIVAVTKTVSIQKIQEALSAGIRYLGENRAQEAKGKIQALGRPVPWHMIGHLQTNKARQAVDLFDMIQSVDSLRLAEALSKEAGKKKKELPILVQVNISGEERKFGVEAEEAAGLIRAISTLRELSVQGLMTIPPYFGDPEESRPIYRLLHEMSQEISSMDLDGVQMKHLSMGMSHDFETAVEEGATLVRVGTDIFGGRA